jgi:hypothetical protein
MANLPMNLLFLTSFTVGLEASRSMMVRRNLRAQRAGEEAALLALDHVERLAER